jgi:hypothetical protein
VKSRKQDYKHGLERGKRLGKAIIKSARTRKPLVDEEKEATRRLKVYSL